MILFEVLVSLSPKYNFKSTQHLSNVSLNTVPTLQGEVSLPGGTPWHSPTWVSKAAPPGPAGPYVLPPLSRTRPVAVVPGVGAVVCSMRATGGLDCALGS